LRGDKLSPLQWRVLRALAAMAPPWALTGGAALAGIYLGHRPTRDLDLFWHDIALLGDLPRAVSERLRSDGLEVSVIQSARRSIAFRSATATRAASSTSLPTHPQRSILRERFALGT
jgi:Nucleotidyl transferase AbiEii toxin, Type IV TA system